MFQIDNDNIPFLRTGAALLILDIQNDIVADYGVLKVSQPPNFMDNIANLVHVFRSCGQIMWILTQFEKHRAVNDDSVDAESVITDNELPANARRAKQRDRRSAFLRTARARMLLARQQNAEDHEEEEEEEEEELEDNEEEEVVVKDEANETYLTLIPGQRPKCCIPGTLGFNFHDSLRKGNTHVFDPRTDLIIGKTHYSAFKSGALVEKLRSSMITDVYVCGALTNISIFATVLDAVRHGYSITIISDCCGFRSQDRHNEAIRRMTESMGCETMTSLELIEDINAREKRDARETDKKRQRLEGKIHRPGKTHVPELDQLMGKLELQDGAIPLRRPLEAETTTIIPSKLSYEDDKGPAITLSPKSVSPPLTLPPPASHKIRVKSKPSTRRRPSTSKSQPQHQSSSSITKPSTSEKISPSSLTKMTHLQESRAVQDDAKAKALQPIHSSTFCEGDSEMITNLFPEPLADYFFRNLCTEVIWQRMSHQGGDVPRLVAVQGLVSPDGTQPVYRHPSDESPPLYAFSKTVRQIIPYVENSLGHEVNHVLIQFYRDGTHHITEHSDKTLDIVPGTCIANVSLGAQRSMTFRTKKSDAAESNPRTVHKETLSHNSMCKFGLKSNASWLHGIRPDRRAQAEKSPEVLAFNGSRISLTFRKIGTFLNRNQTLIWGQGAVAKDEKNARNISSHSEEAKEMLKAFGKENRLGKEFAWEAEYGTGFDILHVKNERRLVLGGLGGCRGIGDARIRILLKELEVDVGICGENDLMRPIRLDTTGSEIPTKNAQRKVIFVDNDAKRSRVEGEIAIALYLDRVYAKGSLTVGAGFDMGKCYTRLLKMAVPPEALLSEMRLWESFIVEHGSDGYMAGAEISLDDYFFWPVLNCLRGMLQDNEVFKNYYDRIGVRRGFKCMMDEDMPDSYPVHLLDM